MVKGLHKSSQGGPINAYLESTDIIDWRTPEVMAEALKLARGIESEEEIARSCLRGRISRGLARPQ